VEVEVEYEWVPLYATNVLLLVICLFIAQQSQSGSISDDEAVSVIVNGTGLVATKTGVEKGSGFATSGDATRTSRVAMGESKGHGNIGVWYDR